MKENKLWYASPANDWNKALPLGNGRLGMMVFGGVGEERIQLNEETFWSGWEYPEYDSPKTFEHLQEMRDLVFAGKYMEAQQLCNRYQICRGKGDGDSDGAFGSYRRQVTCISPCRILCMQITAGNCAWIRVLPG